MSSSPGRFRSPAFTRPARARPFNSTELTRHTSDASARRTLRPARLTSNGSRSVADDDRSTRSIELAFRSDLGAIFSRLQASTGRRSRQVQEGFSTRLDAEGESGSRAREDLALGFFHRKKNLFSRLLASGDVFSSY